MASNYRKLGGYIREIDRRNTENRQDNLLGLSVAKCFIPSVANTVGTDFRKYKVVEKGQFAYILGKVCSGCSINAVTSVSQIDRIKIAFKDLVLGKVFLKTPRDKHL